jgi:aryl-alcohol dehydrogenase-like predicted oxidoreductase
MGMTMAYRDAITEGAAAIATIRGAYDACVSLFDTAELYGMGTGSNEQLVGKAVKPFRDELVIGTKFGFDMSVPAGSGPATTVGRSTSVRSPRTAWGTWTSTTSTSSISTASHYDGLRKARYQETA